MIDIKAINLVLAQGNKLTIETFKQLDGAVVHLELKWYGKMIMNGDATIWHIVDNDTAFGEITDEDDGNVFRGAIARTTIDKIISVPQTTAQIVPMPDDYAFLEKTNNELNKENESLITKLNEANKENESLRKKFNAHVMSVNSIEAYAKLIIEEIQRWRRL